MNVIRAAITWPLTSNSKLGLTQKFIVHGVNQVNTQNKDANLFIIERAQSFCRHYFYNVECPNGARVSQWLDIVSNVTNPPARLTGRDDQLGSGRLSKGSTVEGT